MSAEFRFLAIGGGAAGLAAVRGYRAAGGRGPVAIVSDEGELPYRRPPLTKEFLRGEVDAADLPLEDEGWFAESQVSLIEGRAVVLDHRARRVVLSGGRSLGYGSCVLATGAEPRRLPVPGSDHPRVHTIRSVHHARRLLAGLGAGDALVVIGSGFIGCEIAASLRLRGHAVCLISDEDGPNLARLGQDAAGEIASWLEADGVKLRLGVEVDAIEPTAGGLVVRATGATERAQVVVMAVGVSPRAELLAGALELDDGAVPVDASMRTTLDGVFAAGDVAKAYNAAAGRALRVEHWGDALSQGEIAGATAAGGDRRWGEVPGFWSTIGRRTLKYAAWGDGYESVRREVGSKDSWVARYESAGELVGVLAHNADDAYEQGRERIAQTERPWLMSEPAGRS